MLHSMFEPFFIRIGACLVAKIMMQRVAFNRKFSRTKRSVIFSFSIGRRRWTKFALATCATFVSVTFTPHIKQQQKETSVRGAFGFLLSCDYLPSSRRLLNNNSASRVSNNMRRCPQTQCKKRTKKERKRVSPCRIHVKRGKGENR